MTTVYVTQVPHRVDIRTKAFAPAFNINTAVEHGEIVEMMPPRASFYNTLGLVTQMRQALKYYNFKDGDSILILGDPCISAVAAAILGRDFGEFYVLKWDKIIKRYIKQRVKV